MRTTTAFFAVLGAFCFYSGTVGQKNPLRYRGYYFDYETLFYCLDSRYYDPFVGRFVNADGYMSTGQGVLGYNMFAYCLNSPIIYEDSTGSRPVIDDLRGETAEQRKMSFACINPNIHVEGISYKMTGYISSTISSYIPTPQEKAYAATVYAEAAGQNKRSKQAVAHVMNNRIGTKSSWTDIVSVISADHQFDGYNSPMYHDAMNYFDTGVCNNSIDQAAMDDCLAVVIPIYSGAEADVTGGALYFNSYPNPNDWKYHDRYTQVYVSGTEDFWFYKEVHL